VNEGWARCETHRRISRPANATSREELELFWTRQVDRAVETHRKRQKALAVDLAELLRKAST